MNETYSEKAATNLVWRLLERFGAKGVEFLVSIVLARLLAPNDYGTIALITVFINILQVFVDSGFGTALIQKKEVDNRDYSTVFVFNVAVCLLLYAIIFVCAPLIAKFYSNDQLTPLVRVLSITIVISGVKNIQQAYVSRNLLFKKFFYATSVGTVLAAIVGIYMAYRGYGVWALVTQQITNVLVDTIVLWVTVKWRPQICFDINRFKTLFSFGWKLLVSKLIDTVYADIRQLLIGKIYTSEDLAYYNQGYKYPNYLISNINTSIDSVLLPILSKVQNDSLRVKSMVQKSIQTSTYIMAPLLIGMAVCADSFVKVVLTDKWMPCVPYLRIFCVVLMFYPVHTANLNAIKALGRTDLFLKLEIAKKIFGLVALFVSLNYGVLAIALSVVVSDIFSQIVNTWPNKKLLNYSYIEQLVDIIPNILSACFMGLLVYPIGFLNIPTWIILILQILCGGAAYIVISLITKNKSFYYLLSTLKRIVVRK